VYVAPVLDTWILCSSKSLDVLIVFFLRVLHTDAHKRWNEENRALVESHQKYLQELTVEYEEKLLAEQHKQKQLSREKESLKVGTAFCLSNRHLSRLYAGMDAHCRHGCALLRYLLVFCEFDIGASEIPI
jgi:hypothetical protein